MKRIITMLITAVMVIGLVTPMATLMAASAPAQTDNQHATFIANRWHLIGTDEYGNPIPMGKEVPWQETAANRVGSYWGRSGYGMPDANTSIAANGIARVASDRSNLVTTPMLWTKVYLTIVANDGQSKPIMNETGDMKILGLWYVIMDSAGQVWFDPDGKFHDSRFLETADPLSRAYAMLTLNNVIDAPCISNPLAKVDPSEANNTQGPYQFTPNLADGTPNPFYIEPCYFWIRPELTKIVSSATGENICNAYANNTLKGESRVWQLGIVSKPDYLGLGMTSPLNLFGPSDGVVRAGEWDGDPNAPFGVALPLNQFLQNERFADNSIQDPSGNYIYPTNGTYEPTDVIYRDSDFSGTITIGDIRLANITLGRPPNTTTYLAGTTVMPNHIELTLPAPRLALYNFPAGFGYSPKAGLVSTTLKGAANPGFLGGAGNVITVASIQGITIGSTIKIGPNANGQYSTAQITNIITQTTNTNQYMYHYPDYWGYPNYFFYFYPSNPADGDYLLWGTGANQEIVRIAWMWSYYPWYQYYQVLTFTAPPFFYHDYDQATLPQYLLELNISVQAVHASNEPVVVVSYQPGDFIYFRPSGPATGNVMLGDIRYSNVDQHRIAGSGTGAATRTIGQGAWIDDVLVMEEIFMGDRNDPRYQGEVSDNDWKKQDLFKPQSTSLYEEKYGCMPTYDLSVETDFWQGERGWTMDPNTQQMVEEWRGVSPSVTAVALRSPNKDVNIQHERIAKSTVLDPDGKSFFVHATTIHDVSPYYREYLGLEIFCDNAYDNLSNPNPPGILPLGLDLSDNYVRGTSCEAYMGAVNKGVDLDLDRKLTQLNGSKDYPKFFDMNSDNLYGCYEPIYFDIDNNNIVSLNDKRATPINVAAPAPNQGMIFQFPELSPVTIGDADIGRMLAAFPLNMKFFDLPHPISRLPSGIYEWGENIYEDMPILPQYPFGNNFVSAGDQRKTKVTIGSTTYNCGDTVGIGDVFYNEYPAYMLTLGKNGDYNYMDFPVLPFPFLDVKVDMDKPLKVEQTSHISITIDPPPQPGESIFVQLKDTTFEARQPVDEVFTYVTTPNMPDNWIEVQTQQGQMTNSYFNTAQNAVTLPWSFNFYQVPYTQVDIGLSGFICFGNVIPYQAIKFYQSYWSGYGQSPAPLADTGYPIPRIHVAAYLLRMNSVRWGTAIWPSTGETVFVVTYRGSYGPPAMYGYNYPVAEDVVCQIVLFSNGQILLQYKILRCPPTWIYRMPNYSPASYYGTAYEIGITNGTGLYTPYTPAAGICNFSTDGNVMFTPFIYPAVSGIPKLVMPEDTKWITPDNKTANFEFTPYRGTCLQDGTRQPVEINLYRDNGGVSDPVPRNPPPKTYMVYKEPSWNTNNPWNGRVIAVADTFGYLGDDSLGSGKGDWVLVGNRDNTERRRIAQVHTGTEGQRTWIACQTLPASTGNTRPSTCIPVLNVAGFTPGNPVILGDSTTPLQESHIIRGVYRAPRPPAYAMIDAPGGSYQYCYDGQNVRIYMTNISGTFNVGDYVSFFYNQNEWNNAPPNPGDRGQRYNIQATCRIAQVGPNFIVVENLRSLNGYVYSYMWFCQYNTIEVRDPIKFQHTYTEVAGRAAPVFTNKFSFTLNTGLNFDHTFGEPVIGILYFDPYMVYNKWSRFDNDMYPTRQFADLLPPDPTSPDLSNDYDCYWRGRFDVAPEEIDITSSRKCLITLDQRFPNVMLTLTDHDNTDDVNDPANIPISCPAGVSGKDQTIIANVNVTGAGIAYLATCYGWARGTQPVLPHTVLFRYILQVNIDGTYYWWRWYEPNVSTQIYGVYEASDFVYKWLDNDVNGLVTPYTKTFMPVIDNVGEPRLQDFDCSVGGGVCDPCNKDSMWPCLGDVTTTVYWPGQPTGVTPLPVNVIPNARDGYGRFIGINGDGLSDHEDLITVPLAPSGYPNASSPTYGYIENFGIPVVIDRWNVAVDGSQIMFPCQPLQAGTLHIRVYTYQAIFDYNSQNIHWPGPYFVQDQSYGIDYCGNIELEVQSADPDVNFVDFRMVDHALQNSKVNYTTGTNPLYPMDPPAPRLQSAYDPVIRDYRRQVRSYPGGQSHPWRLQGHKYGAGFNAYPAIWKNQFVKLGTEFYPLTDYGLYFMMTDAISQHIGRRNPVTEPNLTVRWMSVKGPFMTPRYFDPVTLNCILGGVTNPYYEYNGIRGLPITYDYSGEILLDDLNMGAYYSGAANMSRICNPLSIDRYTYPTMPSSDPANYTGANDWLHKWRDLFYGNVMYTDTYTYQPTPTLTDPVALWVFDELIMTGSGKISIELELQNGIKKLYEDCCEAKISGTMREIPVHGLKIENTPLNVTVDKDNTFDLKLTEDVAKGMLPNGEWQYTECNDALMFAWQDKGTIDPASRYVKGALDGWITAPPHSSEVSDVPTAFSKADDINSDGHVTYIDDETEILGDYDMSTNTWTGGYIDARTFQRQDGSYKLNLTEDNKARVKVVGVDIGGVDKNNRPLGRNLVDHIIDDTEEMPLNITAYKYGDDNQDHSFRPLYDALNAKDYSHEVYLAGQVSVRVEPARNLNVTYSPEPLTAGVTSELVSQPLTFNVTDENNMPVNLSYGMPDSAGKRGVLDESIWRNLFKDPHPDNIDYYGRLAILPQYYWVRTDLHNLEDRVGQRISNVDLYNTAFTPIKFDATDKASGNYRFNGFLANDKGSFEVYIYTPDRKKSGVATVKVVSPRVEYSIVNQKDVNTVFTVPGVLGDPDFVMTGGDDRVYKITAKCFNAQNVPLRGVAKTVSVCSGEGKDTARFTPFVTVPRSWWFGDTRRVNFGVDLNNDGNLSVLSFNRSEYFSTVFTYNTWNFRYHDLSYGVDTFVGINVGTYWNGDFFYPDSMGFYLPRLWRASQFENWVRSYTPGCVYNDKYDGTYFFGDITLDNILNFRDSLSLDDNAQTTFFVFASDVCNLGGLVGDNEVSNATQFADVGINPIVFSGRPKDPNYLRYRFSSATRTVGGTAWPWRDGRFQLDWEAFGDTQIKMAQPRVEVLDPIDDSPWNKSLIDANNYDLVYAVPNHMLIRVYPADARESVPINEGAAIGYTSFDVALAMFTGQHERITLGRLTKGKEDPNIRETTIFVTPTGTGEDYSGLYMQELYTGSGVTGAPVWQQETALVGFDVRKGISIFAEVPDTLKVGRTSTLKLKVVVAGETKEPLANIEIKIGGVVDVKTGKTNQKGEVEFSVTPKTAGKIIIEATSEKYGKARTLVGVEVEVAPPWITIEPIASVTNKSTVVIKGKTNPGNIVKVGGKEIKVDDQGNFQTNYTLVEGYNQFDVDAISAAGVSTSVTLNCTRDSVKPEIIVDQSDPNKKIAVGTDGSVILTGRVEPYSQVKINGQDALVVYDIWTIKLSNVVPGKLELTIDATDPAGNPNQVKVVINVMGMDVMMLQDGVADVIINDGKKTFTLPRSPFYKVGKTSTTMMVPVEAFTNFLGETAPVYDAGTKTTTFTIMGKQMVINDASNKFTYDGKDLTFAEAVENVNGVVYIDAYGFTKLFDGMTFKLDDATKTLIITRVY